MKKWQMISSVVVALVAVLSLTVFAFAQTPQPLSNETSTALVMAINDEYKARATYQAVLDKFGSVAPFSNIVQSEATHVAALERLLNAYGLPIPPDMYAGHVRAPATLNDAAQTGVEAEKANVAMYDGFLTFVKESDVAAVFTQLRNASQAKHLPAFQKALSRNTTGVTPLYLGPRWSR
jgi:hypothetical protein